MPALSYRQAGLVLQKGGANASEQQIRDLQRDLRQLGYLASGIDGAFGSCTGRAVMSLQYDLRHNLGATAGGDGPAPVRVADYNRARVANVTGVADQGLVECISEILDDPDFATLPRCEDPFAENRRIAAVIADLPTQQVPIPFLMAILKQESGLKHFHEPPAGDEDTYITVGLDTNADQKHIITSRGYGVGQYTLFHHPPSRQEVSELMINVSGNLRKTVTELRNKFDNFVNGATPGMRADDRQAEIGDGPLRVCKYPSDDPRYMKDCQQCLRDAGTMAIRVGITPVFDGSSLIFQPTQYYEQASYHDVPIRKNVGCDWPYGVRRYNGSGINSYHYQVRVLQHLLAL